jgi:hypothetical protein
MDGPVVIECVTDPLEPPMPPKATKAEMKHLASALTGGERDRARIFSPLAVKPWTKHCSRQVTTEF